MKASETEPRSDQGAGHDRALVALHAAAGGSEDHLGDFVFGAIDGTITTFAVIAGAAGAQLSAGIVVILGIANLVADGFSMGVGNFLGGRADDQRRRATIRTVEAMVRDEPDAAREAVRQAYRSKGFHGEDLERIVAGITSERGRWVETIATEINRVAINAPSTVKPALIMFTAFLLVGAIPLVAYIYDLVSPDQLSSPFLWSTGFTAAAFVLIGAIKARFVGARWWKGALETLALGGGAAALAYGLGAMLRGIVGAV